MEVGDKVKVVNGNHPFAGCEVEITAIDAEQAVGVVTLATGETESENFNIAELNSDMDEEIVANVDYPRRNTIEEAKLVDVPGTPPTDS